MTEDAQDLLRFALALADAADAVSLPAFLDGAPARTKADGTPVTRADTEVEALLRRRISDAFPDHGILGEEMGDAPGRAGTRWIIDPIDGTASFARRIALWATLIAVERDGALLASVIAAPALSQRWFAARGAGSRTIHYGRERTIRVSNVTRLDAAHVVHGGVGAMEREGIGPGFRDILRRSKRDRGFGDALGYGLVAQGSAEAMIETGITAWDLAAPALIVAEAGGRFTDVHGRASYDGPTALATNGHLHDELLTALATDRG